MLYMRKYIFFKENIWYINFMNSKLSVLILSLLAISICTDPDYANQNTWIGDCNAGKTRQSPIHLVTSTSKLCDSNDITHIKFSCTQIISSGGSGGKYLVEAPNAGVAIIQSEYDGNKVRGVGSAAQLHFHTPAEHTIKGKSYELQVDVVFEILDESEWKTEIQALTIPGHDSAQLATTFADGTHTKAVHIIVGYVFQVDSSITDTDILGLTSGKSDLEKVFGCTTSRLFYRYSGSLTTPPCTEGVEFLIYREPIKLSQVQMDAIKTKVLDNSNRNIQNLQSRTVRVTGQACSLLSTP